jgi:O-antigen/teichoic acid export membrane protein
MKLSALFSASRWWNSPTGMTWLSLAGRSAGLLIVTPLVLRFFTPAQTSLWFLFLTINAIAQMADFGFGPSFVRAISYARAGRTSLQESERLLSGPNQPLLATIYQFLLVSYNRLALIGGVVLLVLGTLALLKPISELRNPQEGWIAWGVVWAGSIIVFRNSAYTQWMIGLNQVALVRRTEAACSLVAVAFTAVVLLATHSFVATVFAASLAAAASSFVVRCVARSSALFRANHGSSEDSDKVSKFIWPAAWRSGVGALSCTALIQTLGILYAQVARPTEVAQYLLAMRVMQAAVQLSMVPFYSHIPHFSALYAAGDKQALIKAVKPSMAKSHCLFTALVIAVVLIAQPLLTSIGSQTAFVSPSFWLLLGLGFFLERFGAMHLQWYALSNHIVWHTVASASGAAILVCYLLLTPILGQTAIPIAIVCGYGAIYAPWAAYLTHRHCG